MIDGSGDFNLASWDEHHDTRKRVNLGASPFWLMKRIRFTWTRSTQIEYDDSTSIDSCVDTSFRAQGGANGIRADVDANGKPRSAAQTHSVGLEIGLKPDRAAPCWPAC